MKAGADASGWPAGLVPAGSLGAAPAGGLGARPWEGLASSPLPSFQGHQSKKHTGLLLVTAEAGVGWTGAEPGWGWLPSPSGGWERWSMLWETHAWIGRA